MAEDIVSVIRSKFGTTAQVRKHRGNSLRVVASSKILAELLRRWVGTGAGHKVVPDVVLNSPSPVRKAFLQAWTIGDGGVTTSKRLMNGIHHLLLMEGSLATSYLRKAKGPTVIEGRTVNVHDSHSIRFPRPEELSSGVWRNERSSREPGYPISELPAELRRIAYKRLKVFGNYSRGQRVTKRSMSLLRNRMDELLDYSGTPVKHEAESSHDGFYRSNSKLYDRVDGRLRTGQALLDLNSQATQVERLSQSGLAFLKVVGLEEIDSTGDFVYDVSVPECENFLAGFGGVLCHNTGAGKTTLLNALLTLTRLTTKIVTIEEVQEVNIPHSNWAPLVSRESYAATEEKAGEIGLFDLVKAAMRMRPDILVVGEIRGEEAYVLFQAISTGHGGLCVPPGEQLMVAVDEAPRLMTIEELYNSQADASTIVRNGEQEIAATKARVLVPSYNVESNRMSWEQVRRLSRRKYSGNLLKFRVRGGNNATVTTEHPMLTLRDGKITRVPANEVGVGDLIPCASEIPQQFAPAMAGSST